MATKSLKKCFKELKKDYKYEGRNDNNPFVESSDLFKKILQLDRENQEYDEKQKKKA
jgi:hypothetical protein